MFGKKSQSNKYEQHRDVEPKKPMAASIPNLALLPEI
jgi:hypothetical protein